MLFALPDVAGIDLYTEPFAINPDAFEIRNSSPFYKPGIGAEFFVFPMGVFSGRGYICGSGRFSPVLRAIYTSYGSFSLYDETGNLTGSSTPWDGSVGFGFRWRPFKKGIAFGMIFDGVAGYTEKTRYGWNFETGVAFFSPAFSFSICLKDVGSFGSFAWGVRLPFGVSFSPRLWGGRFWIFACAELLKDSMVSVGTGYSIKGLSVFAKCVIGTGYSLTLSYAFKGGSLKFTFSFLPIGNVFGIGVKL